MKKRNLKIGATPGDEFEMLLFVLDQEVLFARLHLRIARRLAKEASEKPQVLECAPSFFAFTFRAHLESAYLRAGRLFDSTSGTATIPSIPMSAERKAGKFQFATPHEVRTKIKTWKSRIGSAGPLVEKLRDLRNNLIAHLDSKVILNPQEMNKTIAVTFDEVEELLEIAKEITTEALRAYNNSIYVDELVSVNDCEAIFRVLETATDNTKIG
jgi:hypothetical protein